MFVTAKSVRRLPMVDRIRPYSRLTVEGLALLARQIRLARKQRKLSERDLAARAGIARSTLQLIEKGDPKVEIGLVFETAVIAGVSLFELGATTLAPRIAQLDDKLALLPKSERRPREAVKDDF
jgi:transcriptional regulator with XRE-family HTH domain